MKRKEIKRVENKERLELDWNEKENIVKIEMDAITDLINTGVFDAPTSFSLINLHKHYSCLRN